MGTKPFYSPKKNHTIATRAVGVRGPRRWGKLLREVVSNIDVEKNAGTVSFVSYDLLSAGRTMLSQYEKIIYMQQKILKTHSFQTLSGITPDILPKVKDKILKIPGIFAMNRSKQYLSMGKYRLLTQANLPYARLQLIDDILSKVQFSPDNIPPGGSPRRLVKIDEKINPSLKMAWEKQTQKLQTNAWNSIPTWIHQSDTQFPVLIPRPSQSNEDKSVTTNTTIHIDNEDVIQM